MNLLALLKYWKFGLYGLAILTLSCFISYAFGVSEGREQEQNAQIIAGAKEGVKSSKQKDQVKHEINKLPDTDIDNRLRASGWMRTD